MDLAPQQHNRSVTLGSALEHLRDLLRNIKIAHRARERNTPLPMLLVGRRDGAAAMRASCLALAISPSAASIFSASGPTVDAFIAAVQAAPAEVKAIAFDVGANDGRWTKSLYTKLRALDSVGGHHRPLDLVMIEPLSNMKEQLRGAGQTPPARGHLFARRRMVAKHDANLLSEPVFNQLVALAGDGRAFWPARPEECDRH